MHHRIAEDCSASVERSTCFFRQVILRLLRGLRRADAPFARLNADRVWAARSELQRTDEDDIGVHIGATSIPQGE